jgi:hypothetical protein
MASTTFTEDLDDLKALVEQCGIKDAWKRCSSTGR